jgi:hypothetical protein
MTHIIAVNDVENLVRNHFGSISISLGNTEYRIKNHHPNGIVRILEVFGGIQELIEEFIPCLEVYSFEASVRSGIIDKDWVDYTLEKLRYGDSASLENIIRRALVDSNGNPEGRLYRFVVAMLRAGDPWDARRSVSLAQLKNQRCLEHFRGEIGKIADELRNRGIIAKEGNKYRLRVLIPLFSREWWEPYRLGW